MVDEFAHAAISYLSAGRKRGLSGGLLAVLFGLVPDLTSWFVYMIYLVISGGFAFGRPDIMHVPDWVFTLYGASHSLFVFGAVLLAVYLIVKKIPFYLWLWGLHILIDIPTHSREFLPTPFLWPFSNWHFPGISWGTPWLFYSYWSLIFVSFAYLIVSYIVKKRRKK